MSHSLQRQNWHQLWKKLSAETLWLSTYKWRTDDHLWGTEHKRESVCVGVPVHMHACPSERGYRFVECWGILRWMTSKFLPLWRLCSTVYLWPVLNVLQERRCPGLQCSYPFMYWIIFLQNSFISHEEKHACKKPWGHFPLSKHNLSHVPVSAAFEMDGKPDSHYGTVQFSQSGGQAALWVSENILGGVWMLLWTILSRKWENDSLFDSLSILVASERKSSFWF